MTPLLVAPAGVAVTSPSLSPDGRTLYYQKWQDAKFGYVARNLETGEERSFTSAREAVGTNVAFSPDGQQVAVKVGGSLQVMAPDGSGAREIFRCPEGRPGCVLGGTSLAWAPDGKSLYAVARSDNNAGAQLVRIRLDGGPPESLAVSSGGIASISVHPDGRRLMYTETRQQSEIWALENIGAVSGDPAAVAVR